MLLRQKQQNEILKKITESGLSLDNFTFKPHKDEYGTSCHILKLNETEFFFQFHYLKTEFRYNIIFYPGMLQPEQVSNSCRWEDVLNSFNFWLLEVKKEIEE
jgi:hypothetical protein